MSEWISVGSKLPDCDEICYVSNSRYGGCHVAIYSHSSRVFRLYAPNSYVTICLDVTHWIALPPPPNQE